MTQQEAFNKPSAWKDVAGQYRNFLPNIASIGCVVEIGVDYGYSLFTIARDFPDAHVVGIDNWSFDYSEDSKQHVQNYLKYFPNVRVIEGTSSDIHSKWSDPSMYLDIDLLHIDGDHMYSSVSNDFELWSKFVAPGGVVMFHDVKSFPDDVGKFFNELEGTKNFLDIGAGLGFWYKDD